MKTKAPRIIVVLPAYNAARTLERTYADIPKDRIYRIILVDDVSQDQTVEIAHALGLSVVIQTAAMEAIRRPVTSRPCAKARTLS